MQTIINDKLYDTDTSEKLYDRGQGDAGNIENGGLVLYRSPKGTIWGQLVYWPNAFGPQTRKVFAGEEEVRRMCEVTRRTDALTQVFEVEEG